MRVIHGVAYGESRIIDDGNFQYVYDAWNRLVKVRSDGDTDVTFQAAEFFADGRRARKDVSNSGEYDTAEVYFYDGHKIIETRDGSNNVKKQFVHGTQYIDELLMIRVYDKGDFYVHQDANWNVIMLTDLRSNTGGKVAERYVYTPYGEVNVMQETSFGDRDGDEDVDSTDKGTVGTTCNTTPVTGSCRILDLDFDGDYDSTDAGFFDSLPSGIARHPGKFASGLDQPFMHQGLLFEGETRQYQNRYRQLDPRKGRYLQRDPFARWNRARSGYGDGLNLYGYRGGAPYTYVDPYGTKNWWAQLGSLVGLGVRVITQLPIFVAETAVVLISGGGIEGGVNYGRYCGPNNGCAGPKLDGTGCAVGLGARDREYPFELCRAHTGLLDHCCVIHDACYDGAPPNSAEYPCGASGFPIPPFPLPWQPFGASQVCDSAICECMDGLNLTPFSKAWNQREQMRVVFMCDYN